MLTVKKIAHDPTAGFGCCVAALVALLCGCASNSEPAKPTTFRVMTYNIHHGEGLDGKVELRRIAKLIRHEGADIVALQEVDKGVERTRQRDLAAELATLTGLTCVFSNNFNFQGGQYGNAVLTRFPVLTATNLHYQMLRPNEQRGLLQLLLEIHGRRLVFMTTHIDYRPDDAERLMNIEQIGQVAKPYADQPVIVSGDFNATPGSRTHSNMKELFADSWELIGSGDGFTFPADSPRTRIDYLWVSRNTAIRPVRIWVPSSAASDHRPVVAEFEMR